MKMTCQADCTRAGWIEYFATSVFPVYHFSVAPDADLDAERVLVFDHDEQEMGVVRGHQYTWERITDGES